MHRRARQFAQGVAWRKRLRVREGRAIQGRLVPPDAEHHADRHGSKGWLACRREQSDRTESAFDVAVCGQRRQEGWLAAARLMGPGFVRGHPDSRRLQRDGLLATATGRLNGGSRGSTGSRGMAAIGGLHSRADAATTGSIASGGGAAAVIAAAIGQQLGRQNGKRHCRGDRGQPNKRVLGKAMHNQQTRGVKMLPVIIRTGGQKVQGWQKGLRPQASARGRIPPVQLVADLGGQLVFFAGNGIGKLLLKRAADAKVLPQ